LHLAVYFLPSPGESELKGCTARIVPDHSAFRKRNRFGNGTSALRLFELARLLVLFDHVARVIVNADYGTM